MSGELIDQFWAIAQIILIDIVLAGDNAIVVGAAAAGLPPAQQRKVIMIGASLALVARIIFALVATKLLAIIGLLLAGGLLLLWVAWKMWREIRAQDMIEEALDIDTTLPVKTFRSAIIQVAVADISMSLDNVLAVAGAAHGHPAWILIFGLIFAIALMAVAAGYIARLIDRHRWIAYVGLVIIVYVALKMIWEGSHEVAEAVAMSL